MNRPADVWASGASYEPYVGRWSRLVAREFIRWLGIERNKRWLEAGCGTGALTETIIAVAEPASVQAIDRSEEYIAFVSQRLNDSRVLFATGDAQSLRQPDLSQDVAVSGLVLNFLPQPGRAVSEMARVVVPAGIVAAYVWDYSSGMQMMRYFWDAAAELDSDAHQLDEGVRFPLCRPGPLKELFLEAGLEGVDVHAIDVPTIFIDFDDYWRPFLGGQGPAPGYAMSLSQERRDALRERIRSTLPVARDGSIALTARAWAVRGRRREEH